MKQRRLGNSGLQVSVVGLGCNNFGWRIDLEASRKVVDKALELGITPILDAPAEEIHQPFRLDWRRA